MHVYSRVFLVGITVLVSLCLTGCYRTARLYGVDGTVIEARFSYSGSGHGHVSGTFPDGEVFKGDYFTEANSGVTTSLLTTPWGPITQISLQQVGPQVSHITAAGTKHTLIQCISFPRGSHGYGACRDSKGREWQLHY